MKHWGRNDFGQTNVPKDLHDPMDISAGEFSTCALTVDGVRCWGGDSFGESDVPEDL